MVPPGIADRTRPESVRRIRHLQLDRLPNDRRPDLNYHQLLGAAGTLEDAGWRLRSPTASWDFAAAQTGWTVNQILAARPDPGRVSILKPRWRRHSTHRGSEDQADLDALLALTKEESDAPPGWTQAQQ